MNPIATSGVLSPKSEPLLEVQELKMHFPIVKGIFGGVKGYVCAVDDVNFSVNCGETLGIIGESGCGKTTVSRTIVRASADGWIESLPRS